MGRVTSAARLVTTSMRRSRALRSSDGFLIGSRGGAGAPACRSHRFPVPVPAPTRIRDESEHSVLVLNSETDTGSATGAQPDSPSTALESPAARTSTSMGLFQGASDTGTGSVTDWFDSMLNSPSSPLRRRLPDAVTRATNLRATRGASLPSTRWIAYGHQPTRASSGTVSIVPAQNALDATATFSWDPHPGVDAP